MHHSKHIKSSCGRCMHSQHNPCPTELTSCVEGSMTREGSAWWGDVNEKRNKVYEVSRGGRAFPCTTPNPQRPHAVGARTASISLAQPNSLTAAKEARQGREAHGGET